MPLSLPQIQPLTDTPQSATERTRGVIPRGLRSLVTSPCLILSEESSRRRLFEAAAAAAGWDPLSCESVGAALKLHRRWDTRLAVIDLGQMQGVNKAAYLKFAAQLAACDRLLIVADEPTRSDEEVAAWQAGAWVFLANPEFGPGLDEVFAEALSMSEKASRQPALDERQNNDRKSSQMHAAAVSPRLSN